MVDRMMRAARADVSLYEEVEANPSYQQEAFTVVGIVAAVSAVITLIVSIVSGNGILAGIITAVLSVVFAFIGYFAWAFTVYFVGTRVFNGTADFPEMQRTVAYAYTPQVLNFVSIIPIVGPILSLVISLWSAYLGFIAIRQGLDLDNTKSLITAVIAYVVLVIVLAIPTFLLAIVLAAMSGAAG